MMKPKTKRYNIPEWKRQFFKGIPTSSRYYKRSRISLPDEVCLSRYYDWQEGDFPAEDDIVQWLLLFEYIAFTTTGNIFLQKFYCMAPASIKMKLYTVMLETLYPDIEPAVSTVPADDPSDHLPITQTLLRYGGALFSGSAIEFLVNKDVPWPQKSLYGSIPDAVSIAFIKGESAFLPPGYIKSKSLRIASGERENGPTIIIKKKRNNDSPVFQLPPKPPLPQLTEATMAELKEFSRDLCKEVDATFVERRQEGGEVFEKTLSPAYALPGHNESTFLVSGMTHGIIGRGGMGMVYKILVRELEVFHALKILQPINTIDSGNNWEMFCKRFLREAKLLANLHHTHIAQIHGFGEWQNFPYIEMEYVDGADLKTMLADSKGMAAPAVTGISIQIAQALSHAHNRRYILDGRERTGLIHRDLKPQNVMLSKDGESKLLDFGVAMPVGSLTQTATSSSFVGTLQYASPEQISGSELDLRTDIHSFGQVVYEMLTGKPAFPANNVRDIIQKKFNNEWDIETLRKSGVPRALQHTVKTCLDRDPDRRFRSAEDLLSVLEEAHHDVTSENPDAVVREFASRGVCSTPIFKSRKRGGIRYLGDHLAAMFRKN